MITNEFVLLFAYLGLFQGLLLFVYLLQHKEGNRESNILLSMVILGLTLRIGKSILGYHFSLTGWQTNIGLSGILIVGPSLWYYLKILIEKKSLRKKNWVHLLPFLLFVIAIPLVPKQAIFEKYWNYGIVVFHLGTYLGLCLYTLVLKKGHVPKGVFNWCRKIVFGALAVWGFYLLNFLSVELHYLIGAVFYTFLAYALTFLLLNREHYKLNKYNSSKLNMKTSKELFNTIKRLFAEEKIYLESGLSLKTIADRLQVSKRQVSQVINENECQNFYEFVNHYRVEYAKGLLRNSRNSAAKMEVIAYDSGFGNVTSFNVAFKKYVGLTPTEFKHTGDQTYHTKKIISPSN